MGWRSAMARLARLTRAEPPPEPGFDWSRIQALIGQPVPDEIEQRILHAVGQGPPPDDPARRALCSLFNLPLPEGYEP